MPAETPGIILRAIETAPVWLTALGGVAVVILGLGSKTVQAWMDARRSAGAALTKYRGEQEDLRIADQAKDIAYLERELNTVRQYQRRNWNLIQRHVAWDHARIAQIMRHDPDVRIPDPPPLILDPTPTPPEPMPRIDQEEP